MPHRAAIGPSKGAEYKAMVRRMGIEAAIFEAGHDAPETPHPTY
jgi:hypothetical protein